VVDGHPWPAADDEVVWLPSGIHTLASAAVQPGLRLLYLNGELQSARMAASTSIEFVYRSGSRAIAVLNRTPRKIEIDGKPVPLESAGPTALLLPRGQHLVAITAE
jgi:hypothetical protein